MTIERYKTLGKDSKLCILTFTLLSVLLSQCGISSHETELQSESEQAVVPLLLVLGGWNSCKQSDIDDKSSPLGQRMHKEFSRTLKNLRLQFGARVEYVISCFTWRQQLRYYRSSDLSKLYWLPVDRFHELVRKEVRRIGPRAQVFAIGHSHGGWLAMQTTYQLAKVKQIEYLHTLDPISFSRCSPWDFIKVESRVGSFSRNPECLHAPNDWSNSQLKTIRNNTGQWINAYQTTAWPLHSSSIYYASENWHLKFKPVYFWDYKPHTGVSVYFRSWNHLRTAMRSVFF